MEKIHHHCHGYRSCPMLMIFYIGQVEKRDRIGENKMFKDIEGASCWKSVEKISKGWSSDEKYKIVTNTGEALLLRLSAIEELSVKRKEYEIISEYAKLGFCMSMPVAFGICNNEQNVYMILSWIEGKDLENILPKISEEEQYQLGYQAGKILKKIHSIKVRKEDIPEETKIKKKLFQLSRYETSDVRIENDEAVVQYVKDNINQIWKKDPTYLHGDFHPGNLIYMEDGSIGVIDFNRWEVGDPYEEFYKLESFARELSIPYCIGQIKAYFDNNVPEQFWITLAVYVAHASLYSIKWAEKFGQEEIDGMTAKCLQAFDDYNYFKRNVPVWYECKL